MSTVNTQEDVFAALGLRTQGQQRESIPENDASDLGLNDFLKLMVTQLNNQDPFEPMDNGEFLGQIAQFGSVTGLEELNQSFHSLAATITSDQGLQASALIGREVLAPIATGELTAGGTLRGQVTLEQSSPQVTVRIEDEVGQLVREIPMGSAPAGELKFSWDGMDEAGNYAKPGKYTVSVEAVQGDKPVDLYTSLFAEVDSVSLSNTHGVVLNLNGIGPMPFNYVQQIY